MKRIIRSNTELQARQYTADYLSRRDKSSTYRLSEGIKRLIRRYSEDIITPSGNSLLFIRQAGPGLLEFLMERFDVTKQMVPAILNYFAECDTQMIAGGKKK